MIHCGQWHGVSDERTKNIHRRRHHVHFIIDNQASLLLAQKAEVLELLFPGIGVGRDLTGGDGCRAYLLDVARVFSAALRGEVRLVSQLVRLRQKIRDAPRTTSDWPSCVISIRLHTGRCSSNGRLRIGAGRTYGKLSNTRTTEAHGQAGCA